MDLFKGLNEFGKGLINLGIAIIVFAIVQPIINGKFSWDISIASLLVSVILFAIGIFFSSLKEKDNEP